MSITADDPFGLAVHTTRVSTPGTLLVVPRLHTLTPGDPGSTPDGARSTALRSRLDPEAAPTAIRAYAPGDDLRRVHWPLTAHRGELMVRQEEPTGSRATVLVLDPRLARPQDPTLLEWGVELLASATVALADAGVVVTLLAPPPETAVPASEAPSPVHPGAASPSTPRSDGDADVPPLVATGVREALRALALTPTRPPLPGLAAPDGLDVGDPVGVWIEEIGASTRVLLVTGARDLDPTRDLLAALPPGAHGTAVVVTSRGGSGTPPAAEVARAQGWDVVLVSPRTPHAQAWAEVLASDPAWATAGSSSSAPAASRTPGAGR